GSRSSGRPPAASCWPPPAPSPPGSSRCAASPPPPAACCRPPRLTRLRDDLPLARIPLHGEPAPTRRILTVTRRGARENPTILHAIEIITATAEALLP
ncbi:MAG: hypothetical protein FWJ90_16850, partial [Actinomadura sp.]